MMRIALFYKENRFEPKFIQSIIVKLETAGLSVVKDNPDVVLYIGGDGTFLRAVHHFLNELDHIKFVGLNKGHLGFFSDYFADEVDLLIKALSNNELNCKSYRLLKANFSNKEIFSVNEIRVESPFETLICDVEINNSRLETFRGSGLVVSSALGSSAYNRSLGGSIVSPELNVLELTEIAPINNRAFRSLHSSLVLDGDSVINLKPKTSNIIVGFDQLVNKDENSEEIQISLSNKKVMILHKKDFDYATHLNRTFIED